MMNGANHKIDAFSSYPFSIFSNGWERVTPTLEDLPFKGDTIIGNDVWIGYDALIMPGVKIGDGAIIASKSVVVKDVPAYTIVGGNPANEIRRRFSEDVIALLESAQWWNWSAQKITDSLEILTSNDEDALRNLFYTDRDFS